MNVVSFNLPRFIFKLIGFVDMCVKHIPSPVVAARSKVEHIYTGPIESSLGQDMVNCDPEVSYFKSISLMSNIQRNINI